MANQERRQGKWYLRCSTLHVFQKLLSIIYPVSNLEFGYFGTMAVDSSFLFVYHFMFALVLLGC